MGLGQHAAGRLHQTAHQRGCNPGPPRTLSRVIAMLNWLRRLFRRTDEDERQRFFGMVDALNSQAGGGQPAVEHQVLGDLELHSGILSLCDPQLSSALEVPNIRAAKAQISATLWRYPAGTATVAALRLKLG